MKVFQKCVCYSLGFFLILWILSLPGEAQAQQPATLVIDGPVTLSEALVIPSRYTLAGTGIDGEGSSLGLVLLKYDWNLLNYYRLQPLQFQRLACNLEKN